METKICPICGVGNLELKIKKKNITYPFGGEREVDIKEYYCPTCESSGDFFYENEELIEKALDSLKNDSIRNIIEYFNQNKTSMTAIERILSIPFRTLSRWKNGTSKPSATAISLFKFIRLYPWLLEVAENNFDNKFSCNILLYQAFKMCSEVENFSSAGTYTMKDSNIFYMEFNSKHNREIENHY
jgi:DNA-binding transcriptional regulator YiaG